MRRRWTRRETADDADRDRGDRRGGRLRGRARGWLPPRRPHARRVALPRDAPPHRGAAPRQRRGPRRRDPGGGASGQGAAPTPPRGRARAIDRRARRQEGAHRPGDARHARRHHLADQAGRRARARARIRPRAQVRRPEQRARAPARGHGQAAREHPRPARGAGQHQGARAVGRAHGRRRVAPGRFHRGCELPASAHVAGLGWPPRLHVPHAQRPRPPHGREVPARQLRALHRGRHRHRSACATCATG